MPLARADVNIRALAPAILGSRTAGMDASMTHASSVINASWTRRVSGFVALLGFAVGGSGRNKLRARNPLNKGGAAYKKTQDDPPIDGFKQAKDPDPRLM